MKRRVTITARARADTAQARSWYAKIRPELGDEFIDDLDTTLATIAQRPESFAEVERGVRRALCDRFPYKVYFRSGKDGVRVLAVYHTRRDPRKMAPAALSARILHPPASILYG